MAGSFVNVKVGAGVGASEQRGSEPRSVQRREPPPRPREPAREPAREDEPEVTRVDASDARPPIDASAEKRKPTIREIVDRGATLFDLGAGAADGLGAEGAADVMRKTAEVARTGVNAAEAIQREVEPAKKAIKGLWKSMEDRGWVGMRERIDIASMQKRDRASRAKKKDEG